VLLSRRDSPGGTHANNDVLDPRLAWHEGWADYFGVASLDLTGASSLYFDSLGSGVFSFDLEQNTLVGSTPGYWDEQGTASALWDLFDAPTDAGDTGQIPVTQIWRGFRDVKSDTFLYLIDYADRLVAADASVGPLLTSILAERQITYTPGGVPSVPNPFPAPIVSGVPVTGTVDSLTSQRDNLLVSSAFLGFTLQASSTLDATLVITGGPVGHDDLDLVLLDDQGNPIGASANSGAADETLHLDLGPGFYVLQVRSFSGPQGAQIFNKGDFTLTATY
jgi:hypothetical protein